MPYNIVLGHYQAALLYVIPSICCGLLYLGFLRVFGSSNALEMGLMALIICITCAILSPMVIKLHTKHQAGNAVTQEKYERK